jgi:hypothetical protein
MRQRRQRQQVGNDSGRARGTLGYLCGPGPHFGSGLRYMDLIAAASYMQAEALALVAAKPRASLAIGGDLPEDGLADFLRCRVGGPPAFRRVIHR